MPGAFVASVFAGAGCMFIPPISWRAESTRVGPACLSAALLGGTDFLAIFAVLLPAPGFFALVVFDVAFFF
jgi:hypothetical protein